MPADILQVLQGNVQCSAVDRYMLTLLIQQHHNTLQLTHASIFCGLWMLAQTCADSISCPQALVPLESQHHPHFVFLM